MKNVFRFLVLLLLPISAWSLENDLALQHSVSPTSVVAGGNITFTMTVTNDGDNTSISNIQLTDTLPPDITFISAVPAQGSCAVSPAPAASATFTCDLGTLAPNADTIVLLTVKTEAAGFIANTVSVTSTTGGFVDPQPNNNDDDPSSITVQQGADLSVAIVGSPNPSVQSGTAMSYSLTVNNAGPNTATNVRVVDTLPPGFFRTGSLPSGCSQSGQVVTCNVSGSIAKDVPKVIGSITGKIALTGGSTMTNQASVSVTSSGAPQDPILNNTATLDTNVTAGSDVFVTKTQSQSNPITTGTAFSYTLTGRYTGEVPQGITITDNVPTGITVVSASGTGWDCSATAGQNVNCSRATGGGSVGNNVAMPTVTVQVTADTAARYTNTVNIASTGNPADPTSGNNTDSISTTIVQATADLRPIKQARRSNGNTLSPALVVVNDTFKWYLWMRNNGPSDFEGVLTLTDNLPTGVTIDSYTNQTAGYWTCLPAAPVSGPATITCSTAADTVLANAVTSPRVELNATATASGSLNNTVHSTASIDKNGNDDVNTANNTVGATVGSQISGNSADIEILKIVSGNVIAGDLLSYTLEIVNHSVTAATNIEVKDTFTSLINSQAGTEGDSTDQGFEGISVVAGGNSTLVSGNCSSGASGSTGRSFQCSSFTVSQCTQGNDCPIITVKVRPNGGVTPRTNKATAFSNDTSDPNISNNTSNTVSSSVSQRTDLIVSITDTPDPVKVGENITYVATAINQGVSATTDSSVTVTLPEGVTFISASPAGGGSCSVTPAIGAVTTGGDKTVTCSLGALALPSPGNTSTKALTIVVRPTLTVVNNDITATAAVSTTTAEIDSGNNTGSTDTHVDPPSHDLEVFKTDDLNVIGVGDTVVYTLTAQNNGASYATDIQIVDTLPTTELSYVSATPTAGSCAETGGILTCDLGDLASGASKTVTVTMTGTAKGIANNAVVITSAETRSNSSYDPLPANNSKQEETTVKTKADMQVVSKIATPGSVDLREDFIFEIIVKNNTGTGLAEADEVTVEDTLPSGMVLTATPTAVVTGATTLNSCTGSAGQTSFTCSFGTVNYDTSLTINVPVQLISVSNQAQVFTNTATVITTSIDTVPANNSKSGTVTVNSSSIAGRVFRDFNADGLVTANDTGINGVSIALSGKSFDGVDVSRAVITSTLSSVSGSYIFANLPASDGDGYTVVEGAVSETYLTDGTDSDGSIGTGNISVNDTISDIVLPDLTAATAYNFAEIPQARVGIAKQVSSGPTTNADGTFNVTFSLVVKNLGLEELNAISVVDSLIGGSPFFGNYVSLATPATDALTNGQYTVLSAPSGSCTGLNGSFNGGTDTTVATGFTLAKDASCQIDFSIRVRPTAPLPVLLSSGGRYDNQATVTATGALSGQTSPGNPQLTDLSDNGTNADTDSDKQANEAGENDSTPVLPVYASALTITKQLNSNVSVQPDNSILVPIKLVINNSGNEPATVSVTDQLSTAFGGYVSGGGAATLNSGQYTVQTAPSFNGACNSGSLTAGYTGDTGNIELATLTSIEAATSCTIDFVYRFMPTSAATYNNLATVSGNSDFSSTPLTDDDSLAIPYPRIAIAKQVNSGTTTNSDGTVTVPFQLLVKNTGGEILNNVDITDDLSGASPQFGTYLAGGSGATLTAGQYTVQSVPAFNGGCTGGSVNAGYTGDASGTVASINGFAVNASCTIDFSLRFHPQFPLPAGGFKNQALVSAEGAESSLATDDLSDDGTNPDADNDGIGKEDGENDPTPVNASFTPIIGLAKLKSAAEIIHANGTVTVPFRIKVQNYGDEPLVDVKVSDLVSGNAPAFGSFVTGGSGATLNQGEYTIETAPSIEGVCAVATLTSGFTGETGISQIASVTRLEIDQACEFNFTLRFKPQSPAPTGGYSNVATGEAKGELSDTAVSDISQDGVDPDTDSNDDPTNNNTPTPVSFTHTPAIGIAKALQSGLLVNNDGSYTGNFRLVVENLGNETLNNVAINDVMNGAEPHFGTYVAGGTSATLLEDQYTIETNPSFSGACATGLITTGFDGSAQTQVATIAQLPINGVCTIDFGFRFFPVAGQSYINKATTTGAGAFSGATPTDSSDDGTEPDANDDGDANQAGENDPTPVPIPGIGLAKSAGAVVNNGDGTYDVPFTLNVTNAGETSLANVQITDSLDLTAQFGSYTANASPTAGQYAISVAPTVTSQTNGAALTAVGSGVFTGSGAGNALLLPASSSLPNIGTNASSAKILFTVRFFPTEPGPFNNTALATGSSPAGGDVRDDSVDGATPDKDGNGDPGNDTSPTIIDLSGQAIGVAKSVLGVVQTGVKRYLIPYSLIVKNVSPSVTATNVQVTDNLNATFPTAQSISISTAPEVSACSGTELNVNSSFNGSGLNKLLAGNQNLQPGESCTVTFTTDVDFGSNALPEDVQNNQATATVSQTPGGVVIATDLSDDGTVVDENDNNDATETGENDPTPVVFSSRVLSSVSGKVWLDSDHDRQDNDGASSPIADYIVEIVNTADQIVGTTTTAADGTYTVSNLFPSTPGDPATAYIVRFRNPVSDAIYGPPVSEDPTASLNGTVENGVIGGIQLAPGTNTVKQSLPLDPSGVIYDSVTRQPVQDATVTLLSGGTAVPNNCLVSGKNVQVTDDTGFYQYLLVNPAPVGLGCPGDAVYTLQVTQPNGYLPPVSTIIPETAGGPYTPVQDVAPGLDAIQPQPTAPTEAEDTTYYLSFNLVLTGVGVVNNHIPIDPVLEGAIAVAKTTTKTEVIRGELVPYTITATNTLSALLANIDLQDQVPAGFKYVDGSARVDGVSVNPTVNGRSLSWENLSFAGNSSKTIQLILIVGSGVSEGKYVNQAWAMNSLADAIVSNIGSATVNVVPDPLFDCSDLIGKVFDDKNINGYQDEGEPGLAGVRVVTVRGLLITTDDYGRFHLACADVPNELHGSNFIMKLDARTLPSGYRVTTENPRVVRLTRGKLVKLNFGAALHRMLRIDIDQTAFNAKGDQLSQVANEQMTELVEMLKQQPSQMRLTYALQAGETESDANDRMQLFADALTEQWQACDCDNYALTIEQEIITREKRMTTESATGRVK